MYLEYFWSHVWFGSGQIPEERAIFNVGRHIEISEVSMTRIVQQNIVRFDVTMNNIFWA